MKFRGGSSSSVPMSLVLYPPLALKVITPRLTLHGATDELLAQLLPVVRGGVVAGIVTLHDLLAYVTA